MNARYLATALAALLIPITAHAGPSVTLYSRDLGFVREVRDLTLHSARDTVRLEDVSTGLDFTSVRLSPAAGRVERLAYRWDTASGDALIEHAVGQRVRVNSHDHRTDEGVLLASDGNWLVLRGDDGGVSTLARSAVEQVQLASAGAALSLKPALEAVIAGGHGTTRAELSYLTSGLSWSAEHTLVRTGETTAEWSASVQLVNTTGRSYVDARVKLVAGEPSRASSPAPMPQASMMRTMAMASGDAVEAKMSEAAFADYHLYTLAEPVTLRDRETQSVSMISPRPVTVKPRYLYRNGDARGVASQLEVVNSAKSGPGVPLAAGRVRIFQSDDAKDLQFTGETQIAHTPIDEKATLDVGYAFDLAAERRTVTDKRLTDRERQYSVEIKLRNRKPTPVTIVVEEPLGGDSEVLQSSLPSTRKDANTIQWSVDVPAGKEVVLTYAARQRW